MKVLAIVVTYNRLELLKKCIASLKSQTMPLSGILVVNNGATDGTREWLDMQEGLTVLHQENLGGAGGFHNGMQKGLILGYDWFWCMDDDCLVEETAYEALLPALKDTRAIYGSVAVSELDNTKLAWYTKVKIDDQWVETNQVASLTTDFVETTSIPFLGFCIHHEMLLKIGLPEKEMFIWGDDAEMSMRARVKFGIRLFYVTNSRIFHPQTVYIPIKVLGLQMNAVQASPLKRLYEYRNNVYLLKKHTSKGQFYLKHLPKMMLRLVIQNLKIDKDTSLTGWKKQISAVKKGLKGELGRF